MSEYAQDYEIQILKKKRMISTFFEPGERGDRVEIVKSAMCPRGHMFAFVYQLTPMVNCPTEV